MGCVSLTGSYGGRRYKQSYHRAITELRTNLSLLCRAKAAMLNEASRLGSICLSKESPVSSSSYLHMSKDVKALYWYLHFNRSDTDL